MSGVKRALPLINEQNQDYWTGGASGALRIFRCQSCDYYVHPAVHFCPKCESRDVAPESVSGRGVVATYTVNHKQWMPELEVPYVLAIVELDEQSGLRVATNIVNCPPGRVHIGMRVNVLFEHVEDVWVPLFEPEEA